MDSGASNHMASDDGILDSSTSLPSPMFVTVGNDSTSPITRTGNSSLIFPSSNFHLRNVLIVPSLIKNLIFVRRFSRDNSCSIEFDPFGFSIKDLRTRIVILCCNSDGDLYTVGAPAAALHRSTVRHHFV